MRNTTCLCRARLQRAIQFIVNQQGSKPENRRIICMAKCLLLSGNGENKLDFKRQSPGIITGRFGNSLDLDYSRWDTIEVDQTDHRRINYIYFAFYVAMRLCIYIYQKLDPMCFI